MLTLRPRARDAVVRAKHTPLKMLGTRLLRDYHPELRAAAGGRSIGADRSTRALWCRHGRAGPRMARFRSMWLHAAGLRSASISSNVTPWRCAA